MQCSMCGNEYEQAFTITLASGEQQTFDSFECAIHAVAPRCAHCGCIVMGHGVHVEGQTFCCAHCARQLTNAPVRDQG